MDIKKAPVNIPADIVAFYRDLDRVHREFTGEFPPVELTERQRADYLDQQAPLLNYADLRLNREKVTRAFNEICRVFSRHRPQLGDDLAEIEKALAAGEKDIRPLVEKAIWQDKRFLADFAAEHHLNGELLALVIFNAAKPFVTGYAGSLKPYVENGGWLQNHCPVCGWQAALAVRTAGDDRRQLQCSLCDTRWAYKNLKCPHCLNEDHEAMKYLAVEDDEVFRVNVCEKCRGYIKTVNEANLAKKDDTLLTDVKTLHLDIIARREGYLREITEPFLRKEVN